MLFAKSNFTKVMESIFVFGTPILNEPNEKAESITISIIYQKYSSILEIIF
jgi:hypothetical protein